LNEVDAIVIYLSCGKGPTHSFNIKYFIGSSDNKISAMQPHMGLHLKEKKMLKKKGGNHQSPRNLN